MSGGSSSSGSGAGDIRYVCLSDLHLGDRDSILTPLTGSGNIAPRATDAVLAQLVSCMRRLIEINAPATLPTLIVNGDFVDLAFGPMSNALMLFERFAELTLAPGRELFDGILYLPGNHDHHLWELTRETHYWLHTVTRHHDLGMPAPRHVTPLSENAAVPSHLLNAVIGHLGNGHGGGANGTASALPNDLCATAPEIPEGPGVHVSYPNLALHNPERDRAVVFHHGHYVERLYLLFSRGRRLLFPEHPEALTVEQIEAENFAWIDFVWSLLGRSGGAGEGAETIFEMLRYPDRIESFAVEFADRAAPAIRMPFLPFAWARRLVMRQVLSRLVGRMGGERGKTHEVCSTETMQGVQRYLFGPIWRQLQDEFGRVPGDLTFVFGHTHKPFEARIGQPGGGQTVGVINSGGWTVDTAVGAPAFGASIVLLDGELETVALRLFNDDANDGHLVMEVRVPGDGHSGQGPGGVFAAAVRENLESSRGGSARGGREDPWERLGSLMHDAVGVRRRRHRERYGGGGA